MLHAGADWLHVDIFDGSKASNGALSSMGPQTVRALRRRLPGAYLDVHVGCRDPSAVVETLLADGCSSGLTFQFESCASVDAARALYEGAAKVGIENADRVVELIDEFKKRKGESEQPGGYYGDDDDDGDGDIYDDLDTRYYDIEGEPLMQAMLDRFEEITAYSFMAGAYRKAA